MLIALPFLMFKKVFIFLLLSAMVLGCAKPGSINNSGGDTTKPKMGGADAGGGNTVDGILYDFVENSKTKKIRIKSLLERDSVAVALKKLYSNLPVLARLLVQGANNKPWILDEKKLSTKACENIGSAEVEKDIAACQTALEVRINETLWNTLEESQKASFVIHELLVNQVLITRKRYYQTKYPNEINSYKIKSESLVREIVRQIFSEDSIDTSHINDQMKQIDFRFYIDTLYFGENSGLLTDAFKKITTGTKKDEFLGLVGSQEHYTYVKSFARTEDLSLYLKNLNTAINRELKDKCKSTSNENGPIRSFKDLRNYFKHLDNAQSDSSINVGVSAFTNDVYALSALPFLSSQMMDPDATTGSFEYCKVYDESVFSLGTSAFDLLPHEKIFVLLKNETEKYLTEVLTRD